MALKRTLTGAWRGLAKPNHLHGPCCPALVPRARFLSALHPGVPEKRGRFRSRIVTAGVLVWFGLTVAFAQHGVAHADAPVVNYIRLAEVKKHGKNAERKWIIRGTQVYDITDWIPGHPGGDVVSLSRYQVGIVPAAEEIVDT